MICQVFNVLVCKSRKYSLLNQNITNNVLALFGIFVQLALCLLSGFVLPFNISLGTRDNIFKHFGVPVIPFAMMQLLFNEIRKFIIRYFLKN